MSYGQCQQQSTCVDVCSAYLILASDSRFALTTCEDQNLINSVYLIANVASNGDLHRHELAEQSSV
jgi:hypothetical protein